MVKNKDHSSERTHKAASVPPRTNVTASHSFVLRAGSVNLLPVGREPMNGRGVGSTGEPFWLFAHCGSLVSTALFCECARQYKVQWKHSPPGPSHKTKIHRKPRGILIILVPFLFPSLFRNHLFIIFLVGRFEAERSARWRSETELHYTR